MAEFLKKIHEIEGLDRVYKILSKIVMFLYILFLKVTMMNVRDLYSLSTAYFAV